MFRPIGPQPPSVYWRRRLVFLGSIVVLLLLIVLTARAVLGGGGSSPTAAGGSNDSPASHTSTTSRHPSSSPPRRPSTSAHSSTPVSHSSSPSTSAHSSPPPPAATCTPAQLKVAAVAAAPSYAIGAEPKLMIQVTNKGPKPCIQNLADSQIVLRVYNGESRVWGSHDCEVQPGVNNETLAVAQPVRVSVIWSGLSSQPKCAGTRQRVGAGTYTLYASLSGHVGAAAQFSIH